LVSKINGYYVVVDWKTGKKKSQFEIDNGYQTLIYKLAIESGFLFDKPDDISKTENYVKKFLDEKINKIKINSEKSKIVYAFLNDLKKNKNNKIYYKANISDKYKERLSYVAKTSIALVNTRLLPENLNACKYCKAQNICCGIQENKDISKRVLKIIEEISL